MVEKKRERGYILREKREIERQIKRKKKEKLERIPPGGILMA